MSPPLPTRPRAILLARLSDQLGWDVFKVIKNPRLSAYKRRMLTLPDGRREFRVYRPDLREALDLLWAGRADALLCLDLDRAFRDPKDLQDLIDVVENAPHRIIVESCTDSLHMEKGKDNFDAEVRVLVAHKASRDTARRVALARERQAQAGQYGGGRRPFGFCKGAPAATAGRSAGDLVCPWHGGRDCQAGVTPIEAEVAIIADCTRRLLNGVSLRSLAAELRSGDVPTVSGAKWNSNSLRTILLRPRNAGLVVHRGEVLPGVKAQWDPIVSADMFAALQTLLADPSRWTRKPGAPPRWHGTGIYRCGKCTPPGTPEEVGKSATVQVTLNRRPSYVCRATRHVRREVAPVDRLVLLTSCTRLPIRGHTNCLPHRRPTSTRRPYGRSDP